MKLHEVKVHPSKANLKREDQLAWKIAGVAADRVAVERDVAAMIINRIIDNASVAIAAINRRPVVSARDMALGHPRRGGATRVRRAVARRRAARNGRPGRTARRCANSTCTTPSSPPTTRIPGDNIPPILAVAQTMEKSGRDLIRGIATGYEIQIDLVRAICLHEHKIDHIAPSVPGAGGRHRHAAAACSRR